jgi:hypothetical protein
MRTTCKNCWDILPKSVIGEDKDFCSRKCRLKWIEKHKIKGAKKKSLLRQEKILMTLGSNFNNETDRQNSD